MSGTGVGVRIGALSEPLELAVPPQLCPGRLPEVADDDLLGAVEQVEALGRRVDALRVALAAEVAHRSRRELGGAALARRLGCRNAGELLQRATGVAGAEVRRRMRLGRAVRPEAGLTGTAIPPRFAAVAAALEAGTLAVDAGLAIVDTLQPALRVSGIGQVAVAEEQVVAGAAAPGPTSAPGTDADCARLQATVWRAVLDPDGAAPDERDAARRELRLLAPRHGLIPVRGMLLPEVAAALQRYADACTNPRTPDVAPVTGTETVTSSDDHSGAGCDVVDRPDSVGDQRSRAQQLHDVLASIVSVAARAADAPSVAGNPPTLVVAVRAEDLLSGRGTAFADGSDVPIGLGAARQVGCAGAVEQVVLGTDGRIVALGARKRCFTGQQRRAIALRDGGCVIPGCHVPGGWCEVHHVVPHAHDPDGTHTDNGVLLCWHHHRTLDTSGWQIRMHRGAPQIKAPPWLDRSGTWRPARGSPVRMISSCESRCDEADDAA